MNNNLITYLAGGAGILVIILGLFLKSAIKDNGKLQEQLTSQIAATETCVDVNSKNLGVVDDLQAEIEAMIEMRRIDKELREELLNQRARELEKARAVANKLRRERKNEIKNELGCADFASLSISMHCPVNANQLRERSKGPSSHGN